MFPFFSLSLTCSYLFTVCTSVARFWVRKQSTYHIHIEQQQSSSPNNNRVVLSSISLGKFSGVTQLTIHIHAHAVNYYWKLTFNRPNIGRRKKSISRRCFVQHRRQFSNKCIVCECAWLKLKRKLFFEAQSDTRKAATGYLSEKCDLKKLHTFMLRRQFKSKQNKIRRSNVAHTVIVCVYK